jgi:hypothetical protein
MSQVSTLRRFNRNGIHEARRFVENARLVRSTRPGILEDDDLTEILLDQEVEIVPLPNRMRAAEVLDEIVSAAGLASADVRRDVGLWTWLALAWLDELGPIRPTTQPSRFVLEADDFRTYYRHLLSGPWGIFDAHRDDPQRARALLCTATNAPGEVVEQIASKQDLVGSPSVMQAVTDLYVDPSTGVHKRGAAGVGAGSARRLARVLQQLDLTWDVHAMSGKEIIDLLPKEFDRFRPTT